MCFRPSQAKRAEILCKQCMTMNAPDATVCSKCGAELPKPLAPGMPSTAAVRPPAPPGVAPKPPAPPKVPPPVVPPVSPKVPPVPPESNDPEKSNP